MHQIEYLRLTLNSNNHLMSQQERLLGKVRTCPLAPSDVRNWVTAATPNPPRPLPNSSMSAQMPGPSETLFSDLVNDGLPW